MVDVSTEMPCSNRLHSTTIFPKASANSGGTGAGFPRTFGIRKRGLKLENSLVDKRPSHSQPDQQDRADDDAEFQRVLENLVNTPHTPHVEKKEGREPKPAPDGEKRGG